MNSNPFFTNYWAHSQPHPRHPYEYYHSPSPDPVQVAPAIRPSPSIPKVIQILVQFINSEQPSQPAVPALSRSESALRIQKVFRGFLVRKSLEKIKSIKNEVEDVEKRVSRNDYVGLFKENERERVKVNEMLMGLLFKLDSILGFELGVRECRKAVIKKAISLQERVDALISEKFDAAHDNPIDREEENWSEIHQPAEQEQDSIEVEERYQENEAVGSEESGEIIAASEERKEDPVRIEVENEPEEMRTNLEENGSGLDDEKIESLRVEDESAGVEGEEKVGMQGQVEEGGETKKGWCDLEAKEEKGGRRGDEKERNTELLEKMMRLMSQLYDRNEMQTRMLNSLRYRVEQLEKALMCDSLRRRRKKKKEEGHAAAAWSEC